MTAVTPTGWTPARPPRVAAPLTAVDEWRAYAEDGGLAVTARVRVRGADPALLGHFPGRPVLPGVFVIEAVCQAVALAVGVPVPLLAVHSVRFLAPLLDGDRLTLAMSLRPRPGGGWRVTAEGTRADGSLAARVRADFDAGGGDDA